MNGLQLIATGGALPGRTVTNEELSRTVDTSDEWITTRTGIRARHWCTEEESAATLAIAAAKQALERSGLGPQDIACCVCATLSAPDATPSVACQVQRALGLPEDRPALDVNAACSGFIYGTAVARGLLATLGGRYALVVGCEALSRLMDQTDRSTCVLFGDGAGAAIFERCDAPFAITLGARGDEAIHAGGPCRTGSAPISMDGRAVFRFAVDALPRCLHKVLEETQLTLDEVDWVVCHQANSRIIDHCVKALHADAAKFYKNMDRHGNTSAASIPVALNEMAEAGLLKAGQKVSCIGFAGGDFFRLRARFGRIGLRSVRCGVVVDDFFWGLVFVHDGLLSQIVAALSSMASSTQQASAASMTGIARGARHGSCRPLMRSGVSSMVARSTDGCSHAIDGVGRRAMRTTSGMPLVMPPLMPPALLDAMVMRPFCRRMGSFA